MTTEAQFLRDRQNIYRAFLKGAVYVSVSVVVVMAFLAIFRT